MTEPTFETSLNDQSLVALLHAQAVPDAEAAFEVLFERYSVAIRVHLVSFVRSDAAAEGRPASELLATLNSARGGLARLSLEQDQLMQTGLRPPAGGSLSLLARARRARRPGVIFARAAVNEASDPLQDEEARILTGQ